MSMLVFFPLKACLSRGALDKERRATTNRNLKVDKILPVRAHFVVETKFVVADLVSREDKVALAFLFPVQNDLIPWTGDIVVYIKGAA